jgi:hypothetical protein
MFGVESLNKIVLKKMFTLGIIIIEAYRVFTGTLLIVFVDGVCGEHRCQPNENFMNGNMVYRYCFGMNILTFFSFLFLYAIEIRRENKLNTYLNINNHIPTDSETVGKIIEKLTDERKDKILKLDTQYQYYGYIVILFFIINTIFSGYIIGSQYLDNRTPLIFLTSTLFISTKLYDIYSIVNTDKNIFYSAYIRQKAQFNDVNINKCKELVINVN